jgi:hypothetical protein
MIVRSYGRKHTDLQYSHKGANSSLYIEALQHVVEQFEEQSQVKNQALLLPPHSYILSRDIDIA